MLETLIGIAIVGGIIYLNKKGKSKKNTPAQNAGNHSAASQPDALRAKARSASRPIPQPNIRRKAAGVTSGMKRSRRIINPADINIADYGYHFVQPSNMSTYSTTAEYNIATNSQAAPTAINSRLSGMAGGVLVSAAYAQPSEATAEAYAPASGQPAAPEAGTANALGKPSPGRHIGINRPANGQGAAPAANSPLPNPQYRNTGYNNSSETHTGRYILGGMAAGALMYGLFSHLGHHDGYGYPYGNGGFGGGSYMDPNRNPMGAGMNNAGIAEAADLDGSEEAFNPGDAAAAGSADAASYLYGDDDSDDSSDYDYADDSEGYSYDGDNGYSDDADDSYYGNDSYDEDNSDNYSPANDYSEEITDNDSYYDSSSDGNEASYSDSYDDSYNEDSSSYNDDYEQDSYDDSNNDSWFSDSGSDSNDDSSWFSDSGSDGGFFDGGGGDFFDGGGDDW